MTRIIHHTVYFCNHSFKSFIQFDTVCAEFVAPKFTTILIHNYYQTSNIPIRSFLFTKQRMDDELYSEMPSFTFVRYFFD